MAAILPKYKILKRLEPEFCHNIKLVCAYKHDGQSVLIVTKDDNVYATDHKEDGCRDEHNDKKSIKLIKVDELCKKNVINFAYGQYQTIALTKSGQLYSWGGNNWGQLGTGDTVGYGKPHEITQFKGKPKVTDIACGMGHTMALTESGDVFAWGYNEYGQVGNGSFKNQSTPVKIDLKEKITAISCGFNHSMVLTKSGQVYSWGHNIFGQLGIDNTKNQNKPMHVDVRKNVIITKICCGNDHNLLLSKDKDVYTFGKNSCGQLGIGNKENKDEPIKINSSNKFNDIGASIFNNISVAVADFGCYVWGQCGDIRITVPSETTLKSMHEIFANYAARKITYKPISI